MSTEVIMCENYEDCRNRDNSLKCEKCEHNPDNFEKIQRDDERDSPYKKKSFYIFKDNYEPL